MAPIPDEPHYNGASPLDGGPNPATLGGGNGNYSPSALEIGIIVGVISVALLSVFWLFYWRSRRNRARQAQTPASNDNHEPGEELADVSGLRNPAPISKDGRPSTADNDDISSIERPPQYHSRPIANWSR